MKYKSRVVFLILVGMCAVLQSCSSTPNLDNKFGQSINDAKDAMRIQPNNENTMPSHVELISPLEKYQKQDSKSLTTPINSK